MKKERTFIEWFLDVAIPEHKNKIYLEGNGGFGKTTVLKSLCKKLSENYEVYGIIPIYIDAKLLSGRTIPQYIIREYCGNDASKDENLLFEVLSNKKYKYLVVIDGLNEVDSEIVNERIIDLVDDEFENKENIFVVLASRTALNEYNELNKLLSFKTSLKLSGLDNEKVKEIIAKKIDQPTDLMVSVFTNPMMLSIYINTDNKDMYKNIVNQSQVLDIYFKEQWNISTKWRKRENKDKNYDKFIKFIILEFLPNLCRFGESLFQIEDIEYTLARTDYKNSAFGYIYKFFKFDEIRNLQEKHIEIREYLRDNLKLISHIDDYFTIHEIYASYFQAKYFDLTIDAWLKDTTKNPDFLRVKSYTFMDEYSDYFKNFFTAHYGYWSNVQRCFSSLQSAANIGEQKNIFYSCFFIYAFLTPDSKERTREKQDFINLINTKNNIAFKKYVDYFKIWEKYTDNSLGLQIHSLLEELELTEKCTNINDEEKGESQERYYLQKKYNILKLQYNMCNKFLYASNLEGFRLRFYMYSLLSVLSFEGSVFFNYFLSGDAKEFIYQISLKKLLPIIKYLGSKYFKCTLNIDEILKIDNELEKIQLEDRYLQSKKVGFEYFYPIFLNLIKEIIIYNKGNLIGLDFSGLDLSLINLSGIDLGNNNGGEASIFQNSIINKNDIVSTGYYAIPCVKSNDIKLLWYTDAFFSINYTYRKEIVFIFDSFASSMAGITSNYRFCLETNRSSFDNYNFLYIPKGTKNLCCYNFLIKIGATLFQLGDDIEINSIKMISWLKNCNSILIVHKNEEIYFDLDGTILKRRSYQNQQLNKDVIKNNLYKPRIGNEHLYLFSENIGDGKFLKIHRHYDNNTEVKLKDKEFVLGRIGNNKFNLSQYQFNDSKTTVMAVCQHGRSATLREWSVGGEHLRNIEYNGTFVDKCFFVFAATRSYITYYGFDQKYYYLNSNNVWSKLSLPQLELLGTTLNGEFFIFKNNKGIVIYYFNQIHLKKLLTVTYDEILKLANLKENNVFSSAYIFENSVLLSFAQKDIENTVNYNCVQFAVSDDSIDKNCVDIKNIFKLKGNESSILVFDSYDNRLKMIDTEILNIISVKLCEYDNFDFFDVSNYNFFVMNRIVIISSSILEIIILFDMREMNIIDIFNNAIIFHAYKKVLYVNRDIESSIEGNLLNIFDEATICKVDRFINIKNYQDCIFSKEQFTEKEAKYLETLGAKLE